MARFAFLEGPTPIAFAHRGYASGPAAGAENSSAAFEQAVALGFRYLETDVQTTLDGVAVAFHDATLDRVTDRQGRIDRLTWNEVGRARIAGGHAIPRLVDLLGAWPDVRINLDVKAAGSVAPTVAAIRDTGSLDRVCVGSFAQSRIDAVRAELGPRLCTSLGPAQAGRLRWLRRTRLPVSRDVAAGCAQLPARIGRRPFVDDHLVLSAHRHGLQVHAWTVNDRAEMVRLLDLGVDGIMTDRAELLRDVLQERGQWR